MTIDKKIEGSVLTIKPIGRLDTVTSPELEAVVAEAINGIDQLIFDFSELQYISSAGLRVLLSGHKAMMKQGTMVIRNCSADVMEIFEVTGFTDILTIES